MSKKRFQAKFIPYWDIGRVIFEEEQRGKARADYGSFLIKELSKKLSQNLGKGFDISNLKNMRQFYLVFPNGDALRRHLSWTHYRLIMRVDKKEAREFYMVETINNKWGTRELERQIHSLLFERLALSKDKKKILELSKEGQVVREGKDIIKDPYVLEFLGLKEEKQKNDNPTIGLILCLEKNETMVKYTVLEDSDKIYASKYKLYIPTEEELKNELIRERELLEMEKKLK